MTLLTKLQLKDYESGEFSDIKQRSCPETLDLIEHFPWAEQRDHIAIGLTSPSITIEGPASDYLKLAPYYNGKFILYYLDGKDQLYTHSLPSLPEAYPFITSFFGNTLDTGGFKHPSTPFTNNKAHFESKQFIYTMKSASTLLSVCIMSVLSLIFPILSILILISHASPAPMAAILIFGAFCLVIAGAGVLLIITSISHFQASKGKSLTISRGHPVFRFGPMGAPVTYDKKDIQQIIQYGASKGLDGLKTTEILFKDGSSIAISGMILPIQTMALKFPRQQITRKLRSFPFMPRDASAPS